MPTAWRWRRGSWIRIRIKATFVAGTELYDDGKHTGAMPGRILRSGG
jgi:N-acyl-D-aspartate/D-glutamate deacylase